MAQIFTSNQVNHAYVVKSFSDFNGGIKPGATSAVGDTYMGKDVDGNFYFMQKGAKGNIVRTDLIDPKNVKYVKAAYADSMQRIKNAALITINSEALDSSAPIVGEDYILRLAFQNPIGMSPDHEYWKQASVHVVSGMTESDFYVKMAMSLARNMSREAVELLHIYLYDSTKEGTYYNWTKNLITFSGTLAELNTAQGTYYADVAAAEADGWTATPAWATEVTKNSKEASFIGTYTGIILAEHEQEWILGVKQDKPIIFKVRASQINNGTDEVAWTDVLYSNGMLMTGGAEPTEAPDPNATVFPTYPNSEPIGNGHLAAELEYFSMGERADLYRNVGWPDVINTKYMLDGTGKYDMITIHYSYVGSNHAVQQSEKDITLICPSTASGALDTLASNIETAILSLL